MWFNFKLISYTGFQSKLIRIYAYTGLQLEFMQDLLWYTNAVSPVSFFSCFQTIIINLSRNPGSPNIYIGKLILMNY